MKKDLVVYSLFLLQARSKSKQGRSHRIFTNVRSHGDAPEGTPGAARQELPYIGTFKQYLSLLLRNESVSKPLRRMLELLVATGRQRRRSTCDLSPICLTGVLLIKPTVSKKTGKVLRQIAHKDHRETGVEVAIGMPSDFRNMRTIFLDRDKEVSAETPVFAFDAGNKHAGPA